MESIVLRVTDLADIVREMRGRRMDYVRIDLCEEDASVPDDILPARADFSCVSRKDPYMITDFDSLDAVPKSECDFDHISIHTNI